MKALLVATAFLTRIPLPIAADASDVGRAARWFPLVGAALGIVAAVISLCLARLPSLPPVLGALLLVGAGAWVTGAIHLDGLADTADGFGGGRTREEVLRIMRDPAIGSFGAIALLLVMGTRVAALATLLERHAAAPVLVAAPTLSRWTIVVLSGWLPYARPEGGLGEAVTRRRDASGLFWATTVTAVVTMMGVRVDGLILWACAGVVMVALGYTARRRIGGVTGDVFGASVELTETAVLVAATRIMLVRHGEPEESVRGRCYGRLDVGLSARGREQVRRTQHLLADVAFTTVYSSPRRRALESARLLAAPRARVAVDERLREIDFGIFEGLTYDDIARRFPEKYEEWMNRPTDVAFPGGETFAAMAARVRDAFDDLRRTHMGQVIVVVSHGGVNRVALATALDLDLARIFRLDQAYACVNVVDYFAHEAVVRLVNGVA